MTLTPEQRTQRARLAALTRWSNESGKAQGHLVQAGLRARFAREAAAKYPDVGEAEQSRRAECAYRAHMTRLSFLASKARAARKAGAA